MHDEQKHIKGLLQSHRILRITKEKKRILKFSEFIIKEGKFDVGILISNILLEIRVLINSCDVTDVT